MTEHIRYSAACCQTDLPNPLGRAEMRANTDRMLSMIDSAVAGAAPFLPVRLVVFPEFAHAAPVYATVAELLEKLAVPIPNEHTDRLRAKAKEHGIYIQSGSMIETDPRWPGVVFNTTCLIGPGGHPLQVPQGQPVDPLRGPREPPRRAGLRRAALPGGRHARSAASAARSATTGSSPRRLRQLAVNGAEVLVRVSAYMDPWGATEPMDWWTIVNRCRALENMAYVVAANQGAQLRRYPPYSWPGGSMVVDFDGRILAQASPGPGRADRGRARRHLRAAPRARDAARPPHARAPAHGGVPALPRARLPARGRRGPLSYEENNARIDAAKKSLA